MKLAKGRRMIQSRMICYRDTDHAKKGKADDWFHDVFAGCIWHQAERRDRC